MNWLELAAEDYTGSQSISWYMDQLGLLCKSLAFVNEQMAEARRDLNKKKIKSYESLAASSVANSEYFAPSLAKDYIAAKCEREQYEFDLCERCSRTIVHTIDSIRTCISALKTEMQYSFNDQTVPSPMLPGQRTMSQRQGR